MCSIIIIFSYLNLLFGYFGLGTTEGYVRGRLEYVRDCAEATEERIEYECGHSSPEEAKIIIENVNKNLENFKLPNILFLINLFINIILSHFSCYLEYKIKDSNENTKENMPIFNDEDNNNNSQPCVSSDYKLTPDNE